MSQNDDVRRDGYYTVIISEKNGNQNFHMQVYSKSGILYALPHFIEVRPGVVLEVLVDSYSDKL